jgi:hypothetical protein
MLDKKNFIKKVNDLGSLIGFSVEDTSIENYINSAILRNKGTRQEIHVFNGHYGKENKISIQGELSGIKINELLPCIHIAETKTAEQIKKDIDRHLMPSYMLILKKALADQRKVSE